jgi:hypothetical protein
LKGAELSWGYLPVGVRKKLFARPTGYVLKKDARVNARDARASGGTENCVDAGD